MKGRLSKIFWHSRTSTFKGMVLEYLNTLLRKPNYEVGTIVYSCLLLTIGVCPFILIGWWLADICI